MGTSSVRRGWLVSLVLTAGWAWHAGASAQQPQPNEPANVVNIAASGFLDVPQDWLSMTLTTTREGSDAAVVQNQLKQALDAALTAAKAEAIPKQLEVRTGQLSLYPRYGSNGEINGWQGSTELVLEGRDFVRISSTAGKVQTLTMANMAFSLSREAQQKLESDVQALAITRFKARADEVAKGFGFSGYSLRELSISSADQGGGAGYPRPMAARANVAMSSDAAPVPAEAGKSLVNVTVSGSIQLR
ncbi:SIMPL domain-containing protein [Hydrogenophaga sp. A37]|uniref:SIMPL domain-containing protein n=1 Tax=Hydrogenophaga sp. A37 TaxID=1945864 RepID=UPI00098463E9|nr:SIMPL domain-containing protein [Hydrogenophaga sp. A37]OOG85553.1 SIMPL domain-containing protein [Hydrogenophaga sp. A37]